MKKKQHIDIIRKKRLNNSEVCRLSKALNRSKIIFPSEQQQQNHTLLEQPTVKDFSVCDYNKYGCSILC